MKSLLGITEFSKGNVKSLETAFDVVRDAVQKINETKVSPDYDKGALNEFVSELDKVLDLTLEISQAVKGAQFFDASKVYTTDKTPQEVEKQLGEIVKSYNEVQEKLKKADAWDTDKDSVLAAINEEKEAISQLLPVVKQAKEEYEAAAKEKQKYISAQTARQRKANADATDEEIQKILESREAYKKRDEALEQSKSVYEAYLNVIKKREDEIANLKAAQTFSENRRELELQQEALKNEIKIETKRLEWAKKTSSERAAMLVNEQQKRDKADAKRIAQVQKTYKELKSQIQQYEKDIETLKSSRKSLAAAGEDTSKIDLDIAILKDNLERQLEVVSTFKSSEYWPQLQAIDEKFAIESEKKLAKIREKESKKNLKSAVTFSSQASSIEEEKEAISRLEKARDGLSNSTKNYDRIVAGLNKRILAHKDRIEALTRVEKEQNTLADSVINRYRKQLKALDKINEDLAKLAKKRKETGVVSGEDLANEQALVARQKTIQKDIAAIEEETQGQLDEIREQHEAERASKSIDETIKRNEREKQEYRKLLNELYTIDKQKRLMEEHGGENSQEYANLLAQEQRYQQRLSELKRNHMYDRAEIEEEHNKKVNEDGVRAYVEAEQKKQKAALESLKKRVANEKKYGTISKETAERLITFTESAKNVAQHQKAIESLQKARARLDNTDQDYYRTLKKIDEALRRHHEELRLAGVESNNLLQTHRGLLNIGGQLARRFALAFSVSQLTQYFRKLVEVRGQFEKTEVALTSIVGDNQKAQKLMNQTIALAIKSPFTLQQLTGYTKQLAAYQVSYEKLHETTKMLADISAGLGVEMDRLILAFGQVKAANYLRATEVRQFTEAGFNILGELAKYYGELEGKMISVGEVQERVTKRMVDFEDVAAVFEKVTSAGGMFYEMQSKQAETLAGQWSNLKDRIDVMFNEIGTDSDGILKFMVRTLASAIDNWEGIASAVKVAVTALILYKTNLLAVTKAQMINSAALQSFIKSEIKQLGFTKGLISVFKALTSTTNTATAAFSKFVSVNLWTFAITAAISAVISLVTHLNKMNDAIDEVSQEFSDSRAEVKKLAEEYYELSAAMEATLDKEKKLANIEEKRRKIQELSVKLKERNLKLTDKSGESILDIESISDTELNEIFSRNKAILEDSYKLGEELGVALTKGLNAAQGNFLGFSFLGENLEEDAEDLGASFGKVASHTFNTYMEGIENNIRNNFDSLSSLSQAQFKMLAEGRKAEKNDRGEVVKWLESEYDWTKRRLQLLTQIANRDKNILGVQLKLNTALSGLHLSEQEFASELDKIYDKLIKRYGSLDELKRAYKENPQVISAAIQTEIDKQAWDENVKWFANQTLHTKVQIEYNYVEVVSDEVQEQVLTKFQEDLMNARKNIEAKGEGFSNYFISKENIDKMENFSDGLDGLQKIYDELIKKRETLKDTNDEYSKSELELVDAILAETRATAKLWGYDLDRGKAQKDEALDKLKSQISLIKEMNKEYEKVNQKYSKNVALAKVQEAYARTAKELSLDLSKMDFTDEGTIKSLEALLADPSYQASKYALELKEALDNFKVEVGLDTKADEDQRLFSKIQKVFDQYDLTLELKNLNIPQDVAEKLFGVKYIDLSELKENTIKQFAEGAGEGAKELTETLNKDLSQIEWTRVVELIGEDQMKEAKEKLSQIVELADKQTKDAAMKFVEFLTKNLDKTKVIFEQRGIDISFAKKQLDEGIITAEQFAEVVKNIVAQSNAEISKFNLDKFKESPEYIRAMGDLTAYTTDQIKGLIDSLEKVVAENSHLFDADEAKAYQEAIARAREALDDKERSPFRWETFARISEILETEKEIESAKAEKLKLEDDEREALQRLVDLETDLNALIEERERLKAEGKSTADVQKQIDDTTLAIQNGQEAVAAIQSNAKTSEAIIGRLGDKLKSLTGKGGGAASTIAVIDAIINGINDTVQGLLDVTNEIGSVMSSFGKDTDMGTGFGQFQKGFEIFAKSSQYAADGWNALKSGDLVGAVVAIVKSVTSIIKGINEFKDAKIEVSIQKSLDEVERLKGEFEKLEWTIDRAFSFKKYASFATKTENLGKQINNLEKALAFEEDKKNIDEDRVKELTENIEATSREIQELYDGLREDIVGTYQDLSNTLGNAMIDALKQGEDAIAAWGKSVDEIIQNIIGNLLIQKFIEPKIAQLVDSYYAQIMPKNAAAEKKYQQWIDAKEKGDDAMAEKFYNEYLKLVEASIGETPKISKEATEELERGLKETGDWFNNIIPDWFKDSLTASGANLSQLQKGIQGLTEDTGQIIESYLNSVRFYVESISKDTASQLTEVKAIHKLLSSVVLAGHPKGQSGIKVFLDSI